MFGVICILFDGSPYFLCPVGSVLFMVNALHRFLLFEVAAFQANVGTRLPLRTCIDLSLDLLLRNYEYRIRYLRYSLLLDRLLNLRRRQANT